LEFFIFNALTQRLSLRKEEINKINSNTRMKCGEQINNMQKMKNIRIELESERNIVIVQI
jgi:hypothetical protein